jgi:2TM domain
MIEYDETEAQQILKIALSKRADHNQKLSSEQLREIATDLGVSESEFELAEQTWRKNQTLNQERKLFDRYQKRIFIDGVIKYLLVNSAFVGLNLLTSHQVSWSVYLILIWGLGISLQAWSTFHTESESYNQAYAKWLQKQKRNQITNKIANQLAGTTISTLSYVETWLKNRNLK